MMMMNCRVKCVSDVDETERGQIKEPNMMMDLTVTSISSAPLPRTLKQVHKSVNVLSSICKRKWLIANSGRLLIIKTLYFLFTISNSHYLTTNGKNNLFKVFGQKHVCHYRDSGGS